MVVRFIQNIILPLVRKGETIPTHFNYGTVYELKKYFCDGGKCTLTLGEPAYGDVVVDRDAIEISSPHPPQRKKSECRKCGKA